jgi:hypothetical protein
MFNGAVGCHLTHRESSIGRQDTAGDQKAQAGPQDDGGFEGAQLHSRFRVHLDLTKGIIKLPVGSACNYYERKKGVCL